MNRKRLIQLRDTLRGLRRNQFNYADWGGKDVGNCATNLVHCGTAGCIAGWCCTLFDQDMGDDIPAAAREWLGLTRGQADCLFLGMDYRDDQGHEVIPCILVEAMMKLTPQQAADRIDQILNLPE